MRFDEDLFMYHDDFDYGWRLRLAGFRIACVVNESEYHYGSATLGSGSSAPLLYFVVRNAIWVLARNSTLTWFLISLFFFFLEASMSFLAYLSLRHDYKKAVTMLNTLLDGFRGLRIPFSKRDDVMRARKVKETEINRAMNISVCVHSRARALLNPLLEPRRIYAFEPAYENFSLLERTIRLNRRCQVLPVNIILGAIRARANGFCSLMWSEPIWRPR